MQTYSDSDRILEFHTVPFFGRKQIPVVIVFTIISVSSIYGVFYWAREEETLIIKVMSVVLMTFFIYKVLLGTAISWFTNIYHLEINGDELRGENLFGKPFSVNLDNVRELRKVRGWNSFELIDRSGNRFEISAAMDFYGFIYDYILDRLPSNVELDKKTINKFRNRPNYWSYTKRYPFKTEYPPGYLDWFLPIAEAQKKEMIEKGILKPDVLYGQDEDHMW